jgi:hypothetical protein
MDYGAKPRFTANGLDIQWLNENGHYETIATANTPEIAVNLARTAQRDERPEFQDDTTLLIPSVSSLLLTDALSPERRTIGRERLVAFSDALFWLAGWLASASAELAGLIPPPNQPPLEPDEIPIDPEDPAT